MGWDWHCLPDLLYHLRSLHRSTVLTPHHALRGRNKGERNSHVVDRMKRTLLSICDRKSDTDTGTGKRLWEAGGTGWGDAAKVREGQRLPVNHKPRGNKGEILLQFPWKEPIPLTLRL